MVTFFELPEAEQQAKILKRLKEFSRKTYNKIHKLQEEEREATVCQRENSFYVNTVRDFRDRRYLYKVRLNRFIQQLIRFCFTHIMCCFN